MKKETSELERNRFDRRQRRRSREGRNVIATVGIIRAVWNLGGGDLCRNAIGYGKVEPSVKFGECAVDGNVRRNRLPFVRVGKSVFGVLGAGVRWVVAHDGLRSSP